MIKEDWMKKYQLAKKYYENHGNLLIKKDYVDLDENGEKINLGRWIIEQRNLYKEKKLEEEKIELLNNINMSWNALHGKWMKNYLLAKKYYEECGNLDIPSFYKAKDEYGYEHKLGNWILSQRVLYSKGKIEKEQIDLLNEIDMIWDYYENSWSKNYLLAKKYYEEHGNLLIPVNYQIKDNDNNVIKLGVWIITQRKNYKEKNKLSDEQIRLLEEINMCWDCKNYREKTWNEYYLLAKKYYEEHGNLLVPIDYEINTNDGKTFKLGVWLDTQRKLKEDRRKNNNYSKKEEEKMLDEIGMIWELNKNKWMEKYDLCKKYYEEHGNLLIPVSYVVKTNDGRIIKLGSWLNIQRKGYRKNNGHSISDEHIKLLKEIGMVFENVNESIWMRNYDALKKYYEEHGNLYIPFDYVTKDGLKVGSWLKTQKYLRDKNDLSAKEIELLEQIGVSFEKKYSDISWEKNYLLAKKYYEKYNNLNVPRDFIMKDDNDKDIKIGLWISYQRASYYEQGSKKLSEEHIKLLEKIGMIWNLIEDKWERKYLLAKEYFEKNNNLLIPQIYFMKDSDLNDVAIGSWINNQRNLYKKNKLSKEKIEKLNDICMIWDIKEYRKYEKQIEDKYLEYQYGKLQENEINELVKEKIFKYDDDNKIRKGNAYVLFKTNFLNN